MLPAGNMELVDELELPIGYLDCPNEELIHSYSRDPNPFINELRIDLMNSSLPYMNNNLPDMNRVMPSNDTSLSSDASLSTDMLVSDDAPSSESSLSNDYMSLLESYGAEFTNVVDNALDERVMSPMDTFQTHSNDIFTDKCLEGALGFLQFFCDLDFEDPNGSGLDPEEDTRLHCTNQLSSGSDDSSNGGVQAFNPHVLSHKPGSHTPFNDHSYFRIEQNMVIDSTSSSHSLDSTDSSTSGEVYIKKARKPLPDSCSIKLRNPAVQRPSVKRRVQRENVPPRYKSTPSLQNVSNRSKNIKRQPRGRCVPQTSKRQSKTYKSAPCSSRTNSGIPSNNDEHNRSERRRRETQRNELHCLRRAIPELEKDPKAAKVKILEKGRLYIEQLKKISSTHTEEYKKQYEYREKLMKRIQLLKGCSKRDRHTK